MRTELIKTTETSNGVVHYTCNAPKQEICDALGIKTIGETIDRAPRELVIIPTEMFKGREVNAITAEHVMRDASKVIILFSLTRLFKTLKKITNEDLDEKIQENKEVAKVLEGDDSKNANQERMEHDITEDEKKKRNAG